jgi:hypothetical protein
MRPARPRVPRLLIAAVVVALVALVVLRVDISADRSRSARLAVHARQAAASLASARAALAHGRRVAADARADESHAGSDLQAARNILQASGMSQAELRPTEASTGDYLRGLRALQTQARRKSDQLTRAVPVAKGCVSDGLQVLSEASPGQVSTDPASPACVSVGKQARDTNGPAGSP